MVCKEDVCAWFRGLSCAKRLDLMCGLLHMCLPLEKRFLGSFIEDQCRSDYTSLRAEENKSNDQIEIRKLSGNVSVPENRSKIIVILSLLYSSNTVGSNVMFDLLTNLEKIHNLNIKGDLDLNLFDDLLLMLTMAVHHPAFSFKQRHELAERLQHLQSKVETFQANHNEESTIHFESSSSNIPQGSSIHANVTGHNQSKLVHVQTIELIKGSQKRAVEKKMVFQLHVTWSDGTTGDIYKTYQDFSNFHAELIKLFPKDSGVPKQERHIPFLPQEKGHSPEEMNDVMTKYVHQLTTLPDYILECEHMSSFFRNLYNQTVRHQNKSDMASQMHQNNNKKNQTSPSSFKDRESNQSSIQNSPHLIRSQIIYNSQLDAELTAKKMSKHDSPGQRSPRSPLIPVHPVTNPTHMTRHVFIPGTSPMGSPLTSPMSSPYISPASSQYGGSRPGSPTTFNINAWLKRVRLHKYTKNFSKYTINDFLQLKDEDLEKEGLTKGAQKRFRTEIDNIKLRMKSGMNGNFIIEANRPKSPGYNQSCNQLVLSQNIGNVIPSRALFLQHNSNASSREASPSSCSDDYSSPSDSPQPQHESSENNSPRIDDVTMAKMNINNHGSNGSHFRINSSGESCDINGVQNNMIGAIGLQNVSIQTTLVPPIRPMATYAIPPHGMVIPSRQPFFRSPRTPLIRPDYMLPRIPNGVGPMGPPPPILPPTLPGHQANVHDSSVAVTTTSVTYAISQGTMTSPVLPNTGMFLPTTVVPTCAVTANIARPNTLDISQVQQQHLQSGIQTSVTSNGPVQLDSNNKITTVPPPSVPGILNIAPVSSEMNSVSVFHSTGTSTSTTSVSYSVASFHASPAPSPVMNVCPPVPSTQSSPNPTPISHIQQAPPTTIPTPVQHHSSSESPCSDCSQCHKQSTTPHQPANNTTTTFPPHSYQHMWHTPHPMLSHAFMGFHGSNGFVSPAGISNFGPQSVHSYGVPHHNGITPELVLHSHLVNQALAAQQQQQQQQHFWPGHHMQHYTGYVHHPGSGGNGGNGGKNKLITCYNCGQPGHRASDCLEPTMEAITNQGTYHLHMKPKESSE